MPQSGDFLWWADSRKEDKSRTFLIKEKNEKNEKTKAFFVFFLLVLGREQKNCDWLKKKKGKKSYEKAKQNYFFVEKKTRNHENR